MRHHGALRKNTREYGVRVIAGKGLLFILADIRLLRSTPRQGRPLRRLSGEWPDGSPWGSFRRRTWTFLRTQRASGNPFPGRAVSGRTPRTSRPDHQSPVPDSLPGHGPSGHGIDPPGRGGARSARAVSWKEKPRRMAMAGRKGRGRRRGSRIRSRA